MNESKFYAEIGMRSVNRAAIYVFENALSSKQALPIWQNGKVEYVVPTQQQIDELKLRVKPTFGI
jgi:hypothetical protein